MTKAKMTVPVDLTKDELLLVANGLQAFEEKYGEQLATRHIDTLAALTDRITQISRDFNPKELP